MTWWFSKRDAPPPRGFGRIASGLDEYGGFLAAAETVIVTGIGRSGTRFVATVLAHSKTWDDYLAVGHKRVFRGGASPPCKACLGSLDVEVSGFAVPHLRDPGFCLAPVVQVVRHPLDWVRSWRVLRYAQSYLERHIGPLPERGWPLDGPQSDPGIATCLGTPLEPDFVTRALQVWVLWNLSAAERAWFFFRVEDMTDEHVAAIWGLTGRKGAWPLGSVERVLAQAPRPINAHGPNPYLRPSWDDVEPSTWKDAAQRLAERFGYAETG